MDSAMENIPVLEKRRLQAQVIKPIWEVLVARLG
ncbi:MAG: 2-amino-thiazoline-4-carboxylic acid hydrolase, partial [Betaproteobacteria bacterium]|nr:2-amino-thiazoline-4-carboxylic acid hydrolase [Betaproteobacteria bacterium]